jgi:lactoylglutathione lyase
MKILDLFETHVLTTDLEKAADFYGNILGLPCYYYEERRRAKFYFIGGHNESMLGVWEVSPDQWEKRHFAFRISPDDMKQAVSYLKERGLHVRNHLDDGTEKPLVFGWMPAVAIYFRDPDGNSLEFIATLPDEAKPELGVVPWDEWETMHGRN